ncbi:MAG: twin-arginine translocase subunit TatC [Kiritimatiellae bacterium]|nr:twin-arginine translocase subunit TatC [Kiritimatiellia bacterium]
MKLGPFKFSIDSEDVSKPFLEHLEDLRQTILRSIGALAIGMLVAAPLAPTILRWLKRPLFLVFSKPEEVDQFLWTWDVTGAFALAMKIMFWAGLVFAAPFIVLFVAQFVFPGLTAKEKYVIRRSAGAAVGLFAAGVFLAYRFCLPVGLRAMWAMNRWLGVRPQWTITSYIAFTLQFLLAFGLVFELPIVLFILGRLGLISASTLRTYRRHVYVALFIVAAVLTPPDVFSQLLMGIPLVLLYEACIVLIAATEREREAAETSPPAARPPGGAG